MPVAINIAVLLAFLLAWAPQVRGEVVSQGDNGFQLRMQFTVAAPAAKVFDALVNRVGLWWDAAHTYGGDATRLSIDPRPGGCFCEQLPEGAVQHLVVSYVDAGRQLRLLGGIGPLQELGAYGALTFALASADGLTRLAVSYNVSGYFPEGTGALAPIVDRVITEQVVRLQGHVEQAGS